MTDKFAFASVANIPITKGDVGTITQEWKRFFLDFISSTNDITAVGTVTQGVWNATPISISYGGTGQTNEVAALDALGGIGAATTDTLTNKTINAGSNTLSNIGISALANNVAGRLLTWSSAGTPAVVNTGDAGQVLTSNGAGAAPTFTTQNFVQTVEATTTTEGSTTTVIPLDDTLPQNTEGAEFLTIAITPTSASSIIEINFEGFVGASGALHVITALYQDSDADALKAVPTYLTAANTVTGVNLRHRMVAGTTSEIVFKVRIGPASGTAYFLQGSSVGALFGGANIASLTATEYKV